MTLALLMFAILSALGSALLLALSQERNRRIAYRSGAGRPPMMRRLGWPLALLTIALCIIRDGPSFGSILGLFLLAAAFAAITLTLAFRPRWIRLIASPFVRNSK